MKISYKILYSFLTLLLLTSSTKSNQINETTTNENNDLLSNSSTNQADVSFKPMEIFTIYELFMIGFLIIYIFVCLTGKYANDRIASGWLGKNRQFFIDNYAHIGMGTSYDSSLALTKESYGQFKFYASGRKYLNSTLVSIDLLKRYDFVSLVASYLIYNDKDKLIYEISINSPGTPHVFSLSRKKDTKYMKKNYNDIDYMTQPGNLDILSKNYILLTEDIEISNRIFLDKNIKTLYNQIEKYIDIIYFTDRQTFTKEKHILFCSFNINNMTNSEEINTFVHALADKLCTIQLTPSQLKNSERMRLDFEEKEEKIKLAKLKESDEGKEKNLTKEQILKQEEKERKNAMKKQQKGKFLRIMK